MSKAADSIQQHLTDYACGLNYDDLSSEAIHAAKVRVIDTFGALMGGFFAEPCRIARNLAAQMPSPGGATIVGTRQKTTPDMAAFVNGTAARYTEMTDIYHLGHPSDVVTPLLATAEHVQAKGREFITSIVLGYEVYQHIADIFSKKEFDVTNFCCLGTAVAAGKLLGLSPDQLSQCISMAVVPNVVLAQVRRDHQSMFKAVATGHTGRAGVFAALLARAGMEGPHLPFEGKAGWCDHVAGKRFSLSTMGGNGTPFKILETHIKLWPSVGTTISSVLAAGKVAPLDIKDVKQVTVEVYKRAKDTVGTGERPWNPDSRETADHSIPYVVAVILMDGTLTQRSFGDDYLSNPELRALMQKISVVENEDFTKAYNEVREHRTRIIVVTNSGDRLVGDAGGAKGELSDQKSDAQVVGKFRSFTDDCLGEKRVNAILDRLWHLEELENVAELPSAFVLA